MPTILIVDDEAVARRVLASTLTRAGFEVEQACNGEEAWDWLQSRQPDALITDIDMPRMSGKELCLSIEKQFPDRTFPIVVLTSRTEMEHRDWTRAIDNLTFMEKPVSVRRLLSHIGSCLAETDHLAAAQ